MATPIGTLWASGDTLHAESGDTGCCRRVAKPAADIMKRPKHIASITYSGQWLGLPRIVGEFDAGRRVEVTKRSVKPSGRQDI